MTKEEQQKEARENAQAANLAANMSDKSDNKKKNNKMKGKFNAVFNDAENYEPSTKKSNAKDKSTVSSKASAEHKSLVSHPSNSSSNSSLSKNESVEASAKKLFNVNRPNKPIRYGNIRVRQHVVDELYSLKSITHEKSRSDLLDKMIKITKELILTTPKDKKMYKKNIKHYQKVRSEKYKPIK